MSAPPLLMIPGPIEISDAVYDATCIRPKSHVAPDVIEAFGSALEAMRGIWLASADSTPFAVPGGGTLAMESAATNLVEAGERAVIVNTGYFGDRMGMMLERRGATVVHVRADVGEVPSLEAIEAALAEAPTKAIFATYVDTSTGVATNPKAIAALANKHGALSCFDGVCATAAERFEMEAWGADVFLTGSQKAIGLPAGIALWVCSPRAMAAREALSAAPPLTMDWLQWAPIMNAYIERRASYFSTPPTTLVWALAVGLKEILDRGADAAEAMEIRFAAHERAANAMRAAWASLGLTLLPTSTDHTAVTLSAIWYPEGVDASMLPKVKAAGAIIAGGLHPECKTKYFRVGHMGEVVYRPDDLLRTVRAVATGLAQSGHDADVDAAVAAAKAVLEA